MQKMQDKKKLQAQAFLSRDPVLYVSLAEPLRLGRARVETVDSAGVLLRHDTGIAMLAAESTEAALALLGRREAPVRTLTVTGTQIAREVGEHFGMEVGSCCWQAVYTGRERLPVHADIRPLDLRWYAQVLEGYSLFHDPEYIEDRLCAGVMFGAFVDGMLAGFIGEHEEGSMGMLEVFPTYRRRGLAIALESYQINRFLAEGRVPFDQVIVTNDKSRSLQRKLGLVLSQETITWMHGAIE